MGHGRRHAERGYSEAVRGKHGPAGAATGAQRVAKRRPALQADDYAVLPPSILLPITTELADLPSALRVALAPDAANGLLQPSEVMTDIPVTTKADRVHQHLGRLAQADIARVERALGLALGFAG